MWLTVVEADGQALIEDELLTNEEQGDEFLLMGLRLTEGIEPARFEAVAGRRLDPGRIASLVADGMVEMMPTGRLRVSPRVFRCSTPWWRIWRLNALSSRSSQIPSRDAREAPG